MLGALGDPLVTDAVLFEDGAFTEFVATRGVLRPEDERLLAEQWLLIDRSVYEIERFRRGAGFTMRDVLTGDVHQVRERAASQTVKAGALVCARVVPAGDTTQIFGGIELVALHERDELIELLDSGPDPLELVAFLTRRFVPPALGNTEGDPLVRCVTTLKIGDPEASTAKLDQTYQRDDAHTEQAQNRAHRLAPADPAIAAALDRFIRDYEQKWLEESIPALAGPPRQAAADPTRRGNLIQLLDSFPTHHDNPGTMNPDRLRAALSLR